MNLSDLPAGSMVLVDPKWLESLETARTPEVLTTSEASYRFTFSPKTWGKWARAGMIAGAWQDGAGTWRMPYESCAAHIERLSWTARQPNQRKRGPWGKTASTQTRGARTEDLPERKVLRLRSSPVGYGARDHERSGTPQVAG